MTTSNKPNPFISELPKKKDVPVMQDQFICMKKITDLTTLSDKWFYKLIQNGKFPKPIKFGRKSLWLKSEVEHWIQERIFESRGGISG